MVDNHNERPPHGGYPDDKPAAERGEHPPSLGNKLRAYLDTHPDGEESWEEWKARNKPVPLPPDSTRWTSEREMMETLERLQDSDRRAGRTIAGFIGAIVGFILGYFAFGIWPSWPLIVRLFNGCFL